MTIVVLHSGGLDSTVLLYDLLQRGERPVALAVDYGQRHRKELDAAAAICRRAGVEQVVAAAPALCLAGSSQTDPGVAVPEGHYADESMAVTVVPNRNMVLLALAASLALSRGLDAIAYAAHGGDHFIYHDCRAGFVRAMGEALYLCDRRPVRLVAPYLTMTKRDVARLGRAKGGG